MIEQDILNWIFEWKDEVKREDIINHFKFDIPIYESLIKLLIDEKLIIEVFENTFILSEKAVISKNYTIQRLLPKIKEVVKDKERIQAPSNIGFPDWYEIREGLDKMIIYRGTEETLYELHFTINNITKFFQMEGKDIVNYNEFITKFFNAFGVLLASYKGIKEDYGKMITYWHNFKSEENLNHIEELSPINEAKDIILDYISSCSIAEDLIIKEGIITYKNGIIFVSTKIISKILKRNDIKYSMRKIAYILKDYITSCSTPYKVNNKSERFWQFNPKKLEINLCNKLEIQEESEDE